MAVQGFAGRYRARRHGRHHVLSVRFGDWRPARAWVNVPRPAPATLPLPVAAATERIEIRRHGGRRKSDPPFRPEKEDG